ncbi:hypothetical protein FD16_GL001612 [Paucilactobacillus suebicus DSM 5007 = KCTC 3549]|uniref:HTH arsR-type domain-containing protein n=2 Tax=Paucilactobacillus suebicus TaxID=152335 RepID=A0A0R1VW31_9LACO|nr:hypothetical protein FD16_GL001612 [Paucilactobacillus suebicus DSM 5007 = KCTC 3549]
MTIGKIAENFPQNRSVISRHLDLMNRLGAITRRKLGREVYYKINQEKIVDKFDTASTNIKKLFEQA